MSLLRRYHPSTLKREDYELFYNDYCNVYRKTISDDIYYPNWDGGLYGSIAFYSATENKDGNHYGW